MENEIKIVEETPEQKMFRKRHEITRMEDLERFANPKCRKCHGRGYVGMLTKPDGSSAPDVCYCTGPALRRFFTL